MLPAADHRQKQKGYMTKSLPARPDLEQLKKQAKELLKAFKSGDAAVLQRFQEHHSDISGIRAGICRLADAQSVIAREYGFPSWRKLKMHVETFAQQDDPMESLVRAVLADETARAQEIVAAHPELRPRLNDPIPNHGFGTTILLAAVERTNKDMIDLLLRAGADINARSHWWAGGFGVLDDDRGLASFLIERGARLDAHSTARLGMLDKLKELLSANPALVHARGGDGQTPLHFAATVEIADCLLDRGAEIDALDIDHESTPAQYMVRERQEVARHLVARGCRTDILMAAALGDLDLARNHLAANPDCLRMTVSEEYFPKHNPRAGGTIYIWTLGQNKTPHMIARQFGHQQVFRLLMENSPQELKLSQACELGDEQLFRELLASRPDLARKLSPADRRKVVDAAQSNNAGAVRLMLEAGWPVDSRGQHGATALHWAAFHGNAEMCKIILRHHPPLECVDSSFDGKPLGWAIHGSEHGWYCRTGDYPGTVEALLQAGAQLPKEVKGTEAVQAVLRRYISQAAATG
jgi:ankyrin repeat protein